MLWRSKTSYSGKHVLLTGGSTGIGLAIAAGLVRRGAHITLMARTQSKLDDAAEQLRALARGLGLPTVIRTLAADTCNTKQVEAAVNKAGQVDVLICCAGASHPGRFLEQSLDVFASTMNVNYFGTLHVLKAALPAMVERRQGEVVLVSSAAAVCGVAGYSTYAPSKAALRSLADTLRNELLPTGVQVRIAYPPDTDTPGYAQENETKPPECHAVSRAAGDVLYSPEQVAACMVRGMERGAYHLPSPDFGQNLMVAASAGLSPHMFHPVLEFLLAPIVVVVLLVFGKIVDQAVRRHAAPQQGA